MRIQCLKTWSIIDHLHSNLNSSPIWNATIASVRACQTASFPSLWTTTWECAGVLWRRQGGPVLLREKAEFESDVMKQELQSCVSSLACPTLTEHGLHKHPWADNKDVEEHLRLWTSPFITRQRDGAVPSHFHLLLEPLKCRAGVFHDSHKSLSN